MTNKIVDLFLLSFHKFLRHQHLGNLLKNGEKFPIFSILHIAIALGCGIRHLGKSEFFGVHLLFYVEQLLFLSYRGDSRRNPDCRDEHVPSHLAIGQGHRGWLTFFVHDNIIFQIWDIKTLAFRRFYVYNGFYGPLPPYFSY